MTVDSNKKKLCLITLGCKANQYDSAALLAYLGGQFEFVAPEPETPADLYLINTCTVTHKADFDARQWLHRIRRWAPEAKIMVTGCMAETGRAQLEKEKVAHIFGASEREELVREITGVAPAMDSGIFYHPAGGTQRRARAVLKVQDGCDFRCSYCIVPYARGRSRSLNQELVLQQIASLIGQGFEEIVLCGVNLGQWGKDLGLELSDLLETIEAKTKGFRLRLSSLEPMAMSPRLVRTIAQSKIICPHLHIPMQSGDDSVLKQMKRPYTSGEFLATCSRLHEKMPRLCLGLDLIAGFPGEGAAEFENTLRLLERIPFAYLHTFTFSPREHTPAKKLRPKVPERVAQERAAVLAAIDQKRRREFAIANLGGKMEMVVEGRERGYGFGHTENYLYVKARTEKPVRTRAKVRLKKVEAELIAEEE
jgi:threonylcarbamoyladenosine tRNA methylthiotransferase MtaB